MTQPRQTTIMWIAILFTVLIAGIGWVLMVTNAGASESHSIIDSRLTEHERILLNLSEEKGKTRMELIYINGNLERIENKIDRLNE